MGRLKYSQGEREKIMAAFLLATREIIRSQGISRVSIRAVAKETGYSSASLYLYFEDLDELINMSSVYYLEDYFRELALLQEEGLDAGELYCQAWRLFCKYAFLYPEVYEQLFFCPHKKSTQELADAYYAVFPKHPGSSCACIELIPCGARPEEGNFMLKTLVDEKLFSENQAHMICRMSAGYFHKLLKDKLSNARGISDEERTERQLAAIKFLMDRRG